MAKKVICDASRAGLAVHLFMMESFPDELPEDFAATKEFLREVLTHVDSFGFSYDIFPFVAELDTDVYQEPCRFGAKGIKGSRMADLSWRFRLVSATKRRPICFAKARRAIKGIVESKLSSRGGLRHLGLSQDSLHLLLLDAQSENTSSIIAFPEM